MDLRGVFQSISREQHGQHEVELICRDGRVKIQSFVEASPTIEIHVDVPKFKIDSRLIWCGIPHYFHVPNQYRIGYNRMNAQDRERADYLDGLCTYLHDRTERLPIKVRIKYADGLVRFEYALAWGKVHFRVNESDIPDLWQFMWDGKKFIPNPYKDAKGSEERAAEISALLK